jgi:hypothetical protein
MKKEAVGSSDWTSSLGNMVINRQGSKKGIGLMSHQNPVVA